MRAAYLAVVALLTATGCTDSIEAMCSDLIESDCPINLDASVNECVAYVEHYEEYAVDQGCEDQFRAYTKCAEETFSCDELEPEFADGCGSYVAEVEACGALVPFGISPNDDILPTGFELRDLEDLNTNSN